VCHVQVELLHLHHKTDTSKTRKDEQICSWKASFPGLVLKAPVCPSSRPKVEEIAVDFWNKLPYTKHMDDG
jgi:hypothetical protein